MWEHEALGHPGEATHSAYLCNSLCMLGFYALGHPGDALSCTPVQQCAWRHCRPSAIYARALTSWPVQSLHTYVAPGAPNSMSPATHSVVAVQAVQQPVPSEPVRPLVQRPLTQADCCPAASDEACLCAQACWRFSRRTMRCWRRSLRVWRTTWSPSAWPSLASTSCPTRS